ncbi:hypothetical protein J6590_090061 [Homalodisca vitripennis]|nr:hypothetical protein J6590_090061 [Homalodisca vitripennis]
MIVLFGGLCISPEQFEDDRGVVHGKWYEAELGEMCMYHFSQNEVVPGVPYQIYELVLRIVDEVKDLGVIITLNLSWEPHITYARAVKQASGCHFPGIISSSAACCFESSVHNKIPSNGGPAFALPLLDVPVHDIALQLNLPTIKVRRDIQNIIFLYKIVNGIIDFPELLEMVDFPKAIETRSTELFARQHHGTAYELNSPVIRIQYKANLLPPSIDFFYTAVSTIRKSLLAVMRNVP